VSVIVECFAVKITRKHKHDLVSSYILKGTVHDLLIVGTTCLPSYLFWVELIRLVFFLSILLIFILPGYTRQVLSTRYKVSHSCRIASHRRTEAMKYQV